MELAARYADVTLQRSRVLAPLIALVQVLALATSTDAGIPLTPSIIAINLAVIAIGIALSVLLFTRRVTSRWASAAAAFVFWSPVITSGLSFVETHQQHLFVLLLLEMCAGAVMLSWRWLLGSFVVFDLLFVPIALRLEPNEIVFAMLAMLSAQFFAFVFQRLMAHSLAESEQRFAELARSEQARAELGEQLVHAQRLDAVGTLAAGLAHDMNNVLAAIMGLADGLAETVEDPLARADASDILREAERGAELTRGLLSFSRRGHYRREVLRVGALVDEVAAMLGRTLPKTVTIEKQIAEGDACIEGDPTQFSQALVNLGINASDAMSGHGRLVIDSDVIAVEAGSALSLVPGCYVRLRVTDNGSGMDAATRARVFEPFFTTKAMGKGTGLGLALVWGVVKKARGTVTVDSELGRGSTFAIYLPLSASQPVAVVAATASGRFQRGTVLVIDDEPAVRATTARMLERLGLRTLAADGGVSGLDLFDSHAAEIGLVVLDMGMPGMNGAEVFRALRTRGNVPILIATGYAVEEELQQLVATGARLLEKPYKLAALESEVERALGIARAA
jgi:signal transduction histidine kinase/CheY-like chemotaxis protein